MNENELRNLLHEAKRFGFSDRQLAHCGEHGSEGAAIAGALGNEPVFKTVDTCAAEFEAYTPYHYSTYETERKSVPEKEKVVILGGGPNRIGRVSLITAAFMRFMR